MWTNRENCKDDSERAKRIEQHLKPDHKGWYFFSGGPVTPWPSSHPWLSGVMMLVRWLCETSMASGNAPHGKEDNCIKDEPTNRPSRHFKGHQRCPCPVGLAVTGFGKECTLILDKVRLRGSFWTFMSKGPVIFPVFKDRTQRDLRKKQRQRQGVHPEENRQREITSSLS